MMEPDSQLRNLRDFLLVYNRMTEICFQRCSSNFNYRNLTMDEERCVDNCAGKLIRSNHRLMGSYVNLMPRMVQRRMEEMESKAAENAKLEAAAAASASVGPESQGTGTVQNSVELNTDKVELSGVTPLTPLMENMNNVDSGTSITAGLTASQSVESVQSVYTPATSVSEDVHLSTVSVPQMSTEKPAGPE